MVLFLVPLGYIERTTTIKEERVDWFKKFDDLRFPLFVHVSIAGIAWAANLLLWITGLKYTTTVRASLFAQMHPLILVVYLRLRGDSVSSFEWIGVIVSFAGLLLAGSSAAAFSGDAGRNEVSNKLYL